MVKLTQTTTETGPTQKAVLGTNGQYELYHDPRIGKFIIEDTVNGTKAFIRPESSGQLGTDGQMLKSLSNGQPMSDTGTLHSTVQNAVRNSSSWVFVPPGTFNESVLVQTPELTIVGSGRGTLIDGGTTGTAIDVEAKNVTVRDLDVQTTGAGGTGYDGLDLSYYSGTKGINVTVRDTDDVAFEGVGSALINCHVVRADFLGVRSAGESIVHNTRLDASDDYGMISNNSDAIFTNNYVRNAAGNGIDGNGDNQLIGGNRVIGCGVGLRISNSNQVVYNNRVSDSTNADINDTEPELFSTQTVQE